MTTVNHSSGTFVLGAHRCGTSVATQLIAAMGHDLGGEVVPAAEDNPGGYWEHRAVVETHNDFLRSIGHSWSSPLPLEPGVFSGEAASRTRKRIREVFETDFRDKEQWVLKDPRLCRLLPLWDEVLNLKDLQVRFVHVIRSPIAAAASLEKRDGMRLEASLVLWLRHMIEAERATRDRNRLWIAMEELASNPGTQASRLAAWLDGDSGTASQDIKDLVDTIFRPDFFHHRQAYDDPALSDFPWVADVCRELSSWTEVENPSGQTTLDRVFVEISIADRLMIGHPLAAHQSSQREERLGLREEIEDFHHTLTTLREEAAAHRHEGDHLRHSVTAMREEVATHRNETDHLRTLVGELQQMIARTENKHAELLSRSLCLTAEIEKKHLEQTKELHCAREDAQRLGTELTTLHTAFEELENNHQSLAGHLPRLKEEIQNKDTEITRAGDHFTNLEEAIHARDSEITRAGAHITEVEAALERAAEEKIALKAGQAQLLGLIDELRLDLERTESARQSTQEALNSMTNQLSWRVTAPLRKVRGLMSPTPKPSPDTHIDRDA